MGQAMLDAVNGRDREHLLRMLAGATFGIFFQAYMVAPASQTARAVRASREPRWAGVCGQDVGAPVAQHRARARLRTESVRSITP